MIAYRLLLVLWVFPLLALSPNREVTEANEMFFGALLNEDVEVLDGLLDSDFKLVMPDGNPYDRSLVLTAIKSGLASFDTADLQSNNLRMLGTEAAMVSGIWKARGQVQGNTFDYRAFYTSICVRRGNGWKVAQVQLTLVL